MFKYIQLILTAFMLCGVASCGNEVAFEHPTEDDLRKARDAQGLSETSPKTELSVQSDSLIPSLTPEQNTQRASYIKENVDKGMVQLQDQLKKTNTIFFCLLFSIISTFGQNTHFFKAVEACTKVGEKVTLKDRVVSVEHGRSEQIYLNFGKPFPHQDFAIVILYLPPNFEPRVKLIF